MWITNIELDQRISALEKKLIQNNEPNTWQYKWKTWFDEVEWKPKYWDWKEYKNYSWWGKTIFWNSSRSTTGVQSISWLWFEPSRVFIKAFNPATNAGWSEWIIQKPNYQFCNYQYYSWWNIVTNSIWDRVVYCENWWSATIGILSSFNSDWFSINWTNMSWWAVNFYWMAFE